MKNNILYLLMVAIFTLLLSACEEDDELTDFDNSPSSGTITNGSVEIITEDTVRYHVIHFNNGDSIFTSTLVETDTGVVLVDLGSSGILKAGTELREYADALGKSLSIIITHNHSDHYGNINSFADIAMYAQTKTATALMQSVGFTNVYSSQVTSVDSSQTIAGLEFKFGNVSNTETAENSYIYTPSTKALFPGDLLYNQAHNYIREYTPLDSTDELTHWINSLNTLKTTFSNYNHVFVGHNGTGGTRGDVGTLIDENIAYLTDAQALIKGTKQLDDGGFASTNKEVVEELDLLYPDYVTSRLLFSLSGAFSTADPGANWF